MHEEAPGSMMNAKVVKLVMLGVLLLVAGCASPGGKTDDERRGYVLEMERDMLAELVEEVPETETQIEEAPAYAVFAYRVSKLPLILGGLGGGGGYGVVTDNRGQEKYFMRMRKTEWGWGMGTRELAVIFIFEDDELVEQFIERGMYQSGSGAGATAKVGEGGGAREASAESGEGFEAYTITREGVSYGATIRNRRFLRDRELGQMSVDDAETLRAEVMAAAAAAEAAAAKAAAGSEVPSEAGDAPSPDEAGTEADTDPPQ
jgi:lipid-binding SYLF domain-containing protein